MVDFAAIDEALKTVYLGVIQEDLNVKADPLIARISQDTTHIVGNGGVVRDALIGVNGGVGAGTETGALPSPAENQYVQFNSSTKNLFGVIELSDKVVRTVNGPNAGSFIDALDRETKGMLTTARWNQARQYHGNGDGKLVTCKANGTTSTVIEPATGDYVRFLLPGLKVDLRASNGTIVSGMGGVRITDVDFVKNKFTLSKTTTITAGDFLTIQGSYNLELTGLGKLLETLSGSETLYGLNRADYAFLRPYLNANFGAISEIKLNTPINSVQDHWKADINHLSFGDSAYNYYLTLMEERRMINDTMILEGGHKALKFNGMPLVRNQYLIPTDIIMLDTTIFTTEMLADWDWIAGTHGVLNPIPGYPTYRAAVTKYMEIMCLLPAALIKLSGVAAPA